MFSRKPPIEKFSLEFGVAELPEVAARLGAEIAARFGPREETPLSIAFRGEDGALVGGLNGVTHWRWLYIRQLWVAPAQRGQGLAPRLMAEAEKAARARGAIGAYIDTFDPRVARFYERLGYKRSGEIEDFPAGGRRRYLSKRFQAE
jgi:GNAT superfamily N-acetyltransferase